MAKNKTQTDRKMSDKRLNRLLIEKRLQEAFSDLKSFAGTKKFEKNIRKAGKLLSNGFSKKKLDNFRKEKDTSPPVADIRHDTTLLIEELP